MNQIFPVVPENISQFELFSTFPGADVTAGNFYFLACRKTMLATIPGDAKIHVTAHTRYVLYVNGVRVGQGPETGSDGHVYIDTFDVAALLRPGENMIALEIGHQGDHFRTCVPSIPDFWCRLTPEDVFGAGPGEWQVCRDPSRVANSPEFTFQMGYTVVRDLRRLPESWSVNPELLSGWMAAGEAENPNRVPLGWRDIRPLTDDFLRPGKPVAVGILPPQRIVAESVDFAFHIDGEKRTPDASKFDAGSGALHAEKGEGAYLVYDFRREFYGSVILEVDAPSGGVVDMVYGEMLEDGRLQAYYPFEAKPRAKTDSEGHTFADRHILRPGRNTVELRLQERGGRIVELLFRDFGRKLVIRDFGIDNRVYPLADGGGGFRSGNEYYNRLWQISRHTVEHCVGDRFIDCPWREQAFWINDFVVSGLYYFMLTADPKLVRHCLALAVDGFHHYGDMPAVYPAGDPLFFPSMPSLWLMGVYDYYMYSGDESIRGEMSQAIDDIMGEYDRLGQGDILVPNHEVWWNFIDLGYADAKVEIKGHSTLLNALRMTACHQAAQLHIDPVRQEYYRRQSAAIGEAMVKVLWDAPNRRFRDSDRPGFGYETFSVHPAALLLTFDLLPEYHDDFARTLVDPGAIPAEPYFQRYVLEAMGKRGLYAEAERITNTLWKKMIDTKSPTLWEIALKGPKARGISQSLCHAWAAAPLSYAARTLAGIIPLRPGFAEFSFAPGKGVSDEFQLRQPTPQGCIKVVRKGRNYTLTVPAQTVAVLGDGRRLAAGTHRLTV